MADEKPPQKSDDKPAEKSAEKAPEAKEAAKAPAKEPEKSAEEKASAEGAVDPETSKLGKFILKYHTFLSSFVIGAVGLLATSIWQYRQSQTTRWQAEAQQKVAETQAANSWKIERAEILAKNLQVLASTGANTVDQRYGVLLSLARGNILDPELSVSYALELGKDNPEYMQSVLSNTSDKDYLRLSRSFVVSCEEKYGITRAIDACAGDKLAARSRAIGDLILDESEAAATQGLAGPLVMLKDERQVQQNVQRFAALFEPLLTDYYERRLWNDIAKFQAYSPGAHVVAALVLAAARTGEFVTADAAKQLDQFHDAQTQWLTKYLMSPACDAECKGKILEVMISHYEESQGDYDASLRGLLEGPHAVSGLAVSRLHARLLWCQVDATDLNPLRDRVLAPAAAEMLAKPKADPTVVDDLVGLVALTPDPPATDAKATDAWKALMTTLDKPGTRFGRIYRERKATAAHERTAPPPAMRKVSFCNAPAPATAAE
jgi:hypothetical protein